MQQKLVMVRHQNCIDAIHYNGRNEKIVDTVMQFCFDNKYAENQNTLSSRNYII
jgi:hypothetical protein